MEYKGKSDKNHALTWKAKAIANPWHQANIGCFHIELNLALTFAKCSMPREIEEETCEKNSTIE